MTNQLKNCYHFLDLPFSASKEEVKQKEKILIKIQRARALKTGKTKNKKINKIVECSNLIISNIEANGTPNVKDCEKYSNIKDISTQLFILILVSVVAIISYLSLIL